MHGGDMKRGSDGRRREGRASSSVPLPMNATGDGEDMKNRTQSQSLEGFYAEGPHHEEEKEEHSGDAPQQTARHYNSKLGIFWRVFSFLAVIAILSSGFMYLVAMLVVSTVETPAKAASAIFTTAPKLANATTEVQTASNDFPPRKVGGTASFAAVPGAGGTAGNLDVAAGSGGIVLGGSAGDSGAALEREEERCPPCNTMFGKLEGSRSGASMVQDVRMQIRGEPKSGTSLMFEWAVNALMMTCNRLQQLYGRSTCVVGWSHSPKTRSRRKEISRQNSVIDMKVVHLTFKPLGRHGNGAGGAAKCSCENIDRVTVSISHLFKHNLPVSDRCGWQHVDGVTPEGAVCATANNTLVQNHEDLADCIHGSPCRIVDDRLQMLVLRDPRAVVVSSYYYLKTHRAFKRYHQDGESVGEYALRMLPTICRYVHLRFLLLWTRMASKTVEFLYEESLKDPYEWHRRWLSSVGLNLPTSFVREVTEVALRQEYTFSAKGVDEHPGGEMVAPNRSYEAEVGSEVRAKLDDLCRVWLPPVLLDKFGVPPHG